MAECDSYVRSAMGHRLLVVGSVFAATGAAGGWHRELVLVDAGWSFCYVSRHRSSGGAETRCGAT